MIYLMAVCHRLCSIKWYVVCDWWILKLRKKFIMASIFFN